MIQQNDFLTLRRKALERYYGRMNDMQKRAVFIVDGPLLILAGAGSGKTTVLINRIENMVRFGHAYNDTVMPAKLVESDVRLLEAYVENGKCDADDLERIVSVRPVRAWNILAITFTNKAAGELRNRLASTLGENIAGDVQASTFHSLCMRILRREIEALGYSRSFTIYDTDDSLRVIKDGLKIHRIDEKILSPKAILSVISKSKDDMLGPKELMAKAGNDYRMSCIAKVYEYYQTALKSANALDFDDIIVHTVSLFNQFPSVLETYQERWRYIMVDEYQDTNQSQYRLVSMLAAKYRNLCVVGDDDQSIYKFRGATIENILSFENQFENASVIRLEQNYRSTQNILSAANAVIANNTARKGKNLWTSAGDGEKIRVMRMNDELEEARSLAENIMDNVSRGAKWSEHTVLYRMNAQSNSVERALAQRAIPYRMVGGLRFYERKEIKDVVAYLSVIDNPSDNLRLLRIINEPKRGIGASTLATAQEIAATLGESLFHIVSHSDEYAPLAKKCAPLKEFARLMEELSTMAEESPLDEVLEVLLDKTGYIRSLEAQGFDGIGRIENVMELKSNIVKYIQDNDEPSLSGFLEEIALYTDLDNYDQTADAVVLMTIHSAKGLEFENVYLVGAEEGIFPGRAAMNYPDEIEEERRLAYVAITRAKKRLTVYCAEKRMLFGQTMWGRPSRFVTEMPPEFVEEQSKPVRRIPAAKAPVKKQVSDSLRAIGVGSDRENQKSDMVKVGDRVSHNVFGQGVIVLAKPMGNDTLLEIEFENSGLRKVMANFAKLTKL